MLTVSELICDVDRTEMLTETNEERWQRKTRRIYASYSHAKARFIESVEDCYGNYGGSNFRILFAKLQKSVKFHSRSWEYKCHLSGIRLYRDDFESIFWEAILQSVGDYDQVYGDYDPGGEFWLLEHIELKYRTKSLSLITWAKRKRRRIDSMALPLPDFYEDTLMDSVSSNFEEEYAIKDLVQRLMADPS